MSEQINVQFSPAGLRCDACKGLMMQSQTEAWCIVPSCAQANKVIAIPPYGPQFLTDVLRDNSYSAPEQVPVNVPDPAPTIPAQGASS